MSAPRVTTYVLQFPVTMDGKEIKELQVRRPKGRDLRHIPGGNDIAVEDMFPFFSLLISVNGTPATEELLEEMDSVDLNAIGELVAGFSTPGGRKATPVRGRSTK